MLDLRFLDKRRKNLYSINYNLSTNFQMDLLAQLVRALVCGTGGRGFETHTGPKVSFIDSSRFGAFFI